MDSIKQTITELSAHFNARMEEFQQNILGSSTGTNSISIITAQFNSFRTFVLAALEGLQIQVQILYKSQENLELRSRRKILLIHGIPETKDEKIDYVSTKVLSEHLKIPVCPENLSHCQRLGRIKTNKPRAVLLTFHDIKLRNNLWFAKTGLRNSGLTLSEFLTKERHDVFLAARQRYGVSKCYTKDGQIFVIGQDGSRHRVRTVSDLDTIPTGTPSASTPANITFSVESPKTRKPSVSLVTKRPKRNTKK